MNDSLITVRYVKALFQLAEESGIREAVEEDAVLLAECIRESQEFNDFLADPFLKSTEKKKLMDTMFKGRIQDLSLRFLYLLIDNKREMHLLNICQYFIRYYKENRGIKEASITTSKPLSSGYKKEILDYITKKFRMKIELSEYVDPAIIGGFVLRIDDQQINASLKAQLNKIKRELINS
ncbi:MAG: ATP synthase F1 subunit delta [Bacteroidales bacterium]|jgi:F-type H+-transporting ATPase subunit delta